MRAPALLMLLTLVLSGVVSGQDSNDYTQEERTRVNRNFDRNAPGIGETLPNVELFDAKGKPFSLASLKGSHTVLIFGCLT